jgi:hypothetical protein
MNKKRGLLISLLLLVWLFSACSPQVPEEETPGDDLEEPTEAPAYESYFESLTIVDSQAHPVDRVPMTGDITDVLNEQTLLTSNDHQILAFDLLTKETTLLAEEGWNERLSMDKKVVAFENQDGIHTVSVNGENSKQIYQRESNVVVRDYILSRDGKTVLISLLDGDDYRTLLVDPQGTTKTLNFGESASFRITKPLFLTAYRLYALAEYAQNVVGADGNVIASSIDFVYVELSSGNKLNITGNVAGDRLEYMDQSSTGNILLRHVRHSTNEEGLVVTETYRTFNTSTEFISTSSVADTDILVFKSIDDEKDYVTVERPDTADYRYPSMVEIKRYVNQRPEILGTLFTGAPAQIFYHNGYVFFHSNGDLYRIKM